MTSVKHVFIVRHGHAEFDMGLDFDRPLTSKGIESIKKTAVFIKNKCSENQITLEICICSSAKRTQETSQILCQLNDLRNCHSYKELYSTVVSQWLEKIAQVNESTILIVGHNPTLSQMVNNLCGYEFYMKPAECALIRLEIQPDGIIYPATLIDTHQNE